MSDETDIYEARRIELQGILENVLGSKNVYFQPPSNVRMKYPAIVYTRTGIDPIRANNGVYKMTASYEVVVIDANPDSSFVYKIAALPMCRHTNHFEQDNLNHDTFKLFY